MTVAPSSNALYLSDELLAALLEEMPTLLDANPTSNVLARLHSLLRDLTPEPEQATGASRLSTPDTLVDQTAIDSIIMDGWRRKDSVHLKNSQNLENSEDLGDSEEDASAPKFSHIQFSSDVENFFGWCIGDKRQGEELDQDVQRPAQRVRVEEGGVEGGNGGPPPKSKNGCNRKGDRARANRRADELMDVGSDDEYTERTTSQQRAAKRGFICDDSAAPGVDYKTSKVMMSFLTCDVIQNTRKISRLAKNLAQLTWDGAPDDDGCLASSIRRYTHYEDQSSYADFMGMITAMQVSVHVDSMMVTGTTLEKIAADAGISKRRLKSIRSKGQKCCKLAAGGTMYLLIILAALDLTSNLTRDGNYDTSTLNKMAKEMRNPTNTEVGKLIASVLIPTLHTLSSDASLMAALRFPFKTREGLQMMTFSDFRGMEKILDEIVSNTFLLPVRSSNPLGPWADLFIGPLPTTNPQSATSMADDDDADDDEDSHYISDNVVNIKTAFRLGEQPLPFKNDEEARALYTHDERIRAEKAHRVSHISELDERLQDFYVNGSKKDGEYIHFSSSSLDGATLKIDDAAGQVILLLMTHLKISLGPQTEQFTNKLRLLFQGEQFDDDSKREAFKFLANHYNVCYNRYSERGDGAPVDCHPDVLRKEDASRVNHGQRIPHPSGDVLKFGVEFGVLCNMVSDMARFAAANIKEFLPEQFKDLEIYTEMLPLFTDSPVAPFGGFVLNISSCTSAHRDTMDKGICLLLFFGTWTGGEICLVEPGLVLEVQEGDVLVFPSGKVTHFNLHFEGSRISIVMHSDRHGDSWVRDRNGWTSHINTFGAASSSELE